MKIRNGFVSNSSSSSFMAVGIDYYHPQFRNLLNALGFDEDWRQIEDLTKNGIQHVDFGQFRAPNGMYILNDDCNFIGLDGEQLFRKNKTFSQAKTIFVKLCAELGILINKLDISIKTGETRGC